MSDVNEIANDIVDINGEYGFASVKDGEHRYLLDTGNVDTNERLRTFVKLLQVNIAAALASERAKPATSIVVDGVEYGEHMIRLLQQRSNECCERGFIDAAGNVRKVLGTLPVLASGEFVTEGEVVHHPNQDLSIPGDLWIQKVDDSVLSHSRFPESLRECEYVAAHYYAEYDVGFFFAEFFDVSECYSTPEAATSALDAAKEQP